MDKADPGGPGSPPSLPDPKFDVGLGFTPAPSFNVVDDYVDMDDTLNSYLLSLNDLPPTSRSRPPPGGPANGMSFELPLEVSPSQEVIPNADVLGVPNLSGQQPGVYVQGNNLPGVMSSTGMGVPGIGVPGVPDQNAGDGTGPGFVFRGNEEGGGGEVDRTPTSTSHSDDKGRQRKRRELDSPEADLDSMSADKKQQVMQEKNRLAQRRFRERQKAKVQDLHRQIEELRTKVDSLEVENTSLQSQNSILEKVLVMRDEQIGVMQENSKILDVSREGDSDVDKVCQTAITLQALRGKVVQLTCDMLKNMTTDELMQLWQNYVTEISSALVEANSNSPEAMDRIDQLIGEVCMLCMRFAVLNPIACKMWSTRQYHLCESEELKRWQAVMSTLDMTKDQKVEVITLRKMLLQKLQQLVEERRKLNLTIQTTLPSSTVGHRIALEYLKANQAVVRLKEILRSEHNAMLDFVSTIVKKVLKPIQVARLMVQAYPSKPDLLAVASAVAIETGEDVRVLPEPGKNLPMLPSNLPQGDMLEGGLAMMGCPMNTMDGAGGSGEIPGKIDSLVGDIGGHMPSGI